MNWGERGFGALFAFILAFLLGPSDFGTVAMAMVYILFIQLFLEQGLVAALIQRKDLRPEHLDSVFWMILTSSFVLMGLSVALSGRWASVNHLPKLAPVICALSLSIPIEGLDVVQRAILQRAMDFKSLSVRCNIAVLLGGVVGLGMAFMGFGVWALVGQRLSQDTTALALLWKLSRWRPHLRFSAESVRQLLGFSIANFTGRLAVLSESQSDALLMGIFFGPIAVGLYRLADRIANTCLQLATGSLQMVSLPEFSRLQDKREEIGKSMLGFIRACSIATLPPLAGVAVVSDALMGVIGPKWALAADVLKILSLLAMPVAFSYFTGPLLQAISKPHQAAMLVWARVAGGVGALLAAATILRHASLRGQVLGIAMARFASGALVFAPIFIYVLLRVSRISLRKFLATISPALSASAATVTAVVLLNLTHLLAELKPISVLVAEVILGGVVGGLTLLALDAQLKRTVATLIPGGLRGGKFAEETNVTIGES
jgi:PST family polysaccharide transporter